MKPVGRAQTTYSKFWIATGLIPITLALFARYKGWSRARCLAIASPVLLAFYKSRTVVIVKPPQTTKQTFDPEDVLRKKHADSSISTIEGDPNFALLNKESFIHDHLMWQLKTLGWDAFFKLNSLDSVCPQYLQKHELAVQLEQQLIDGKIGKIEAKAKFPCEELDVSDVDLDMWLVKPDVDALVKGEITDTDIEAFIAKHGRDALLNHIGYSDLVRIQQEFSELTGLTDEEIQQKLNDDFDEFRLVGFIGRHGPVAAGKLAPDSYWQEITQWLIDNADTFPAGDDPLGIITHHLYPTILLSEVYRHVIFYHKAHNKGRIEQVNLELVKNFEKHLEKKVGDVEQAKSKLNKAMKEFEKIYPGDAYRDADAHFTDSAHRADPDYWQQQIEKTTLAFDSATDTLAKLSDLHKKAPDLDAKRKQQESLSKVIKNREKTFGPPQRIADRKKGQTAEIIAGLERQRELSVNFIADLKNLEEEIEQLEADRTKLEDNLRSTRLELQNLMRQLDRLAIAKRCAIICKVHDERLIPPQQFVEHCQEEADFAKIQLNVIRELCANIQQFEANPDQWKGQVEQFKQIIRKTARQMWIDTLDKREWDAATMRYAIEQIHSLVKDDAHLRDFLKVIKTANGDKKLLDEARQAFKKAIKHG